MQTIGERLEEARKRKGISIREAAETTKIRGDYLQKFEANSFDVDLPPLYVRGFLRSYARYLDLDPDRVVSDFDALGGRESKPARRENREVFGRVDFSEPARSPESGEAAQPGGRSDQEKAVMLKFGLLGGGALVAVIVVILLVKVLFGGSPAKPNTSQGDTQTVHPVATREAVFTITVIEPTRVKIAYADNSAVFLDGKFDLNRGETKTIRYSKELLITVQHPDRLRLELNGRAIDVPAGVKAMGQFRVPFEAPQ